MAMWFTSDHHFGHANIIKLCNRPFADVDEMTEVMIERWNSRVKPGDSVIHLGDFFSFKEKEMTAAQATTIKDRLNGSIASLIRGNHDRMRWIRDLFPVVIDYHVMTFVKPALVLFHYPIEGWDGQYHGAVHLHGHSHEKSRQIPGRLDVGVDAHDFYPWSPDEIMEHLSHG